MTDSVTARRPAAIGIQKAADAGPAWLATPFDAPVWRMAYGTPDPIPWNRRLADGTRLTDRRYAVLLGSLRELCRAYMDSDLTGARSPVSVVALGGDALRLADWLVSERRVLCLSQVRPADFEAWVEHVKRLGLTVGGCKDRLEVWGLLWELRGRMADSIGFNPFPGLSTPSSVAGTLGKPQGRTPTLSPEAGFYLLDKAIRWVDRYADDILRLRDAVEAWAVARMAGTGRTQEEVMHDLVVAVRRGHPTVLSSFTGFLAEDDPACPWPIRSAGLRKSDDPARTVTVQRAVNFLRAACALVIVAFTAMRRKELLKLEAGCVVRREDGWWLRRVVTKGAPNPHGVPAERPIPAIVATACRVLERLSRGSRAVSGGRFLFLSDGFFSQGTPIRGGGLLKHVQEFARAVGMPAHKDRRPLALHQLRRFYALMYVWRYEIGALEALRDQMSHASIRETLIYGMDPDAHEFETDAGRRLLMRLLEEALTGRRGLAGGYGEFLERYRRRLRTRVRVLSIKRLRPFIERLVREQGITIRAHPHGYCVQSRVRHRVSVCATDGEGPDYANRTDDMCARCPNFCAHAAFREHWELQEKAHAAMLAWPDMPEPMRAAAECGARSARSMIARIEAAVALRPVPARDDADRETGAGEGPDDGADEAEA